jgi:hypothetical protein
MALSISRRVIPVADAVVCNFVGKGWWFCKRRELVGHPYASKVTFEKEDRRARFFRLPRRELTGEFRDRSAL